MKALMTWLSLLFLCAATPAQTTRPARAPAALTPASAAVYIELPAPAKFIAIWENSTPGQMFHEPSVQAFLAPLRRDLSKKTDKLSASMGMDLEDALKVITGPLAVCYLHHPYEGAFQPGKNAVIFGQYEDAKAIRGILEKVLKDHGISPTGLKYKDSVYWTLSTQKNPSVLTLTSDTAIWAGSEKALKTFIDQGMGAGPSLAEATGFKNLHAQIPRPSDGYLLFADVARLEAALTPFEQKLRGRITRLMEVLGGHDTRHLMLTGHWGPEGGIHETLMVDAPLIPGQQTNTTTKINLAAPPRPRGLLSLSGPQAITDNHLLFIPPDVNSFNMVSLNFEGLYHLVFKVLGALDTAQEERARGQLAKFEKKSGISLREAFTKTFGSYLANYTRLATKPGILSSLAGQTEKVLLIEIKDSLRARELVGKLLALNPEIIRKKIETTHRGHTISTVIFNHPGILLQLNYALTEKCLIISNKLASVMELLDRLSGTEKTRSILDQKHFCACAKRLTTPGERVAVFYTDVQKNFEFLYSVLNMGLTLASHSTKPKSTAVDLDHIPAVGDISKHLFGAYLVVSRTPNGFIVEHTSPFGGATVLMSLGSWFMPIVSLRREAPTMSMKDRCRGNLRVLYKALTEYAATHNGQTPAPNRGEVDALMARLGETRPEIEGLAGIEKLLGENALVGETDRLYCPLQPDRSRFGYIIVSGINLHTLKNPGEIILAFDHPDNHDDMTRNVLFANGTVSTLSELDFQKLMVRQSTLNSPAK